MFKYTDRSKWNNSIPYHLLLSFVLWVPVAALFLYGALEFNKFYFYLLSFLICLIWGLFLFKRAQAKILFPTIEVTDTHIILNIPFRKRDVYNLEYIEGARFFWMLLYFRHCDWPVLAPLPRLPKSRRAELIASINGS